MPTKDSRTSRTGDGMLFCVVKHPLVTVREKPRILRGKYEYHDYCCDRMKAMPLKDRKRYLNVQSKHRFQSCPWCGKSIMFCLNPLMKDLAR